MSIVDPPQLGSRRDQVQGEVRQLSHYFRGYDVMMLTNYQGPSSHLLLRLCWKRPCEELLARSAGTPSSSARLSAAAAGAADADAGRRIRIDH